MRYAQIRLQVLVRLGSAASSLERIQFGAKLIDVFVKPSGHESSVTASRGPAATRSTLRRIGEPELDERLAPWTRLFFAFGHVVVLPVMRIRHAS